MIRVYNPTLAPGSVTAEGVAFTVPSKEWIALPFHAVEHSGESYSVKFYQSGALILKDPDPVFKTSVTDAGGVFLLVGVAFFAWCAVSVLNRLFQ